MDFVDTLKIIVPVIIALCGAVFVMMRWAIDRQQSASQQMWETIKSSLLQNIEQVSKELASHKKEYYIWRNGHDVRFREIESRLSEFQTEVAGGYIKRDDWLEHAMNVERKIDELRKDVHAELKELGRLVSKSNGSK